MENLETLEWKEEKNYNTLLENYIEKIVKQAKTNTHKFDMRMPKKVAEYIKKWCEEHEYKTEIEIKNEISNNNVWVTVSNKTISPIAFFI